MTVEDVGSPLAVACARSINKLGALVDGHRLLMITLSRSGDTGRTLRAGWRKRCWRVIPIGLGMLPGLQISDSPGAIFPLPHRIKPLIWTKDTLTSPRAKTTLGPSVSAVSARINACALAVEGKFSDVVWRVSCSFAVSCEDGRVKLWKENLEGSWEFVSDMIS